MHKLLLKAAHFQKLAGILSVPQETLQRVHKDVMQAFCSMCFTLCLLKEADFKYQSKLSDDDRDALINLRRVEEVCKTYKAEYDPDMLKYGYVTSANIPISIPNKDILVGIDVYLTSSNKIRDNITKELNVKDDWKGLFSFHENKVYLYFSRSTMNKAILDLEDFLFELNDMRDAIRHELQHAVQMINKRYRNLPEYIGLPSKRIREKGFDPTGFSAPQKSDQLDHQLRDIEFYTNLTDSIQTFKMFMAIFNSRLAEANSKVNAAINPSFKGETVASSLHDIVLAISPKIRLSILKAWLNEIDTKTANNQIKHLIQNDIINPIFDVANILDPNYRSSLNTKLFPNNMQLPEFTAIIASPVSNHFFYQLRFRNPEKYKKAVKEFYKATLTILK